ncbi:MAG TPA: feruloyl-CoA synthase [Opitutaceae bacterium]|nr:feruloyl-CoA synthase [Opitutaceae bacterium]
MHNSPIPFRPLNVATWTVSADRAPDGSWYVRPRLKLGSYPATLTERLDYWAGHEPDRTFLAERNGQGSWRRISYTQFRDAARNAAQWLIERKIARDRQIVILSGNDIEHAILAFAAMYCGIPYAPISPAYSTVSPDFNCLRQIMGRLSPAVVFAADGAEFERAIGAVAPADALLVVRERAPGSRPAVLFGELQQAPATSRVDEIQAGTGPDTIAKVLFTSGSTGAPKGVITTQRMLCSNQEMLRTVFPFLGEEPPVICDWMPWHHTFGGSHNIGLVLHNGGTMYIDHGKPMPGSFDQSLRNLREVPQTVFFNVPKGFEVAVSALEADAGFREHFFARLRMAFFAAAGLPQHIWDGFDRLALQTTGMRIPILTGLGSTETAPFAMSITDPAAARSGMVGLPVPGVDLKLAPVNGKLEARVRGPNVTPGFWSEPGLTRAAMDEEGYYRMGDALSFVEEANPAAGFLFDGRLAEDFKLSTGTWVSVGPLRARFILHGAPWVKDLAIAGHDRDEVTALIFPDADHYGRLERNGGARDTFERLLREFAATSTGSSNRIARAIMVRGGPSMEAGEVTDKGSLNQAAVLKHRAKLVEQLYAHPVPEAVIVAE